MILTSSSELPKAHRAASGSAWIYAGSDSDRYARIAAELRSPPAVEPEAFQKFVTSRRADFIHWIDASIASYTDADWLRDPFERNPFRNQLFLTFCWLQWLESNEPIARDLVVVVDSFDVFSAVERFAVRRGVALTTFGRGRLSASWKRQYWRELASGLKTPIEWAMRFFSARMARPREQSTDAGGLVAVTYVTSTNVFDERGAYRDQFFPGMQAWYAERGIAVRFFPWITGVSLSDISGLASRLARTPGIVLPETQVSPWRFMAAVGQWAKLTVQAMLSRQALSGNADDFRTIIQRTADCNAFQCLPLLICGAAVAPLSRRFAPRAILLWYENQTKDKYLLRRFKAAGDRVIAVQSYTACPNHVSLFITEGERRLGVAPDRIWVPGTPFRRHAMFDSKDDYAAVPSWRYQSVNMATAVSRPAGQPFSLLVALPYNPGDAHWVMRLSGAAIERVRKAGGQVWIKPHLSWTPRERTAFRELFAIDDTSWTDEAISALLPRASIVVSSGTSVVVEALALGVPAVVAGAIAGLTMNPVEGLGDELSATVYSPEALVAEVERALANRLRPVSAPAAAWFARLDRDSHDELLRAAS